jgi:hypothetical protein
MKKSLKPVDSKKNPGLSKLPTEVRNKMGYAKKGMLKKAYDKYAMGGDVMGSKNMKENMPGMMPMETYAKGGKKWIKDAIKKPGALTKKAKSAGMSTSAYANKVTKPGSKASTTTKRQANLAKTLSKMKKK